MSDLRLIIETDAASYSPHDTVAVSLTNGRPSSVYVMNQGCDAHDGKPLPNVSLERREQGAWAPYALEHGCGGINAPTELAPEETYGVEFLVGLLPGLPPGTYRCVFYVLDEAYDHEAVLPEEERTSNTFEVEGA